MRKVLILICIILPIFLSTQPHLPYSSLDKKHPIILGGDQIIYNGKTITLGPNAFFVDGQLPDSTVRKYPYVFNSVNKAAEKLSNGTEANPMTLYLAPWVYWIDNPDDTAVRVPKEGSTPYGLVIKCEWLKFQGLTEDPVNVVLASNRGQTIGARGNFTMFKFIGQGTGSQNITFGNYCSVDLVYPLKPSLNRTKRAPAIVQAQLIHCNGDKIIARNTRFISRLNLCPFVGGKRVLFDRCHFESTDDALCGTGVYLNCSLDFYSSKPFYYTTGTGAVFLHCAVKSFAGSQQYFTKAGGQMALIDTRFTAAANTYWGWQDVLPAETKNYQLNVTTNGKALLVGAKDPSSTVDLAHKELGKAYRFVLDGQSVYNTYNLLKGDDDWDPMNIKPLVAKAALASNKPLTGIPVQMLVTPTKISIETKKNETVLKAVLMRFGNYASAPEKITWTVSAKDKALVNLIPGKEGQTCVVIPTNETDSTRPVMVTAHTASGLEGVSLLYVSPAILKTPGFSASPAISMDSHGYLNANYQLDSKYADHSNLIWYRSKDSLGGDAIPVAVTRFDAPLKRYLLTQGDEGYFIMVSISPEHIRSNAGEAVKIVYEKRISVTEIKTPRNSLMTDFKNVPVSNQPAIIPGFWTFDYVHDNETEPRNTADSKRDAWYFGEGMDGAAGMTGLLQGRSGSMSYTPVGKASGDMKLVMTVAPFKTAGQGFSVAHLYMDVLINYDAKTKSGYALRFIRTTKYGDAVDCMLMRYNKGKPAAITEPVTTSAFNTICTITMEIRNGMMTANVQTTKKLSPRQGIAGGVILKTEIRASEYGGFGIEYNGGSPTMIREVKVEWNN